MKESRLNGPLQRRGTNTTGIQEAIEANNAKKHMKKVSMIADGIVLGEAKESFFGLKS